MRIISEIGKKCCFSYYGNSTFFIFSIMGNTIFFPLFYSDVQFLVIAAIYGPMLYSLSEITGIIIAVKRKTRYYFYISITSAMVAIFSALYLVPLYGAKGAFTAVMLSYLAFFNLRTIFAFNYLLNISSIYFVSFSILSFILITLYVFYGYLLNYMFYLFTFIISIIYILFNTKNIGNSPHAQN